MSTKTASKVVSDVLEWEQDARYSREELTLAISQTCLIGTVLRKDGADIKILSANVNEVQTLVIVGTTSAGVLRISGIDKDGIEKTANVAWNTTFATVLASINTALDTIFGAGLVVATGSAYTAITITFSGAGYAGIAQPMIEVDIASYTGATSATVTQTTAGSGTDPDVDEDTPIIGVSLSEVTTDGSTTQKIVAAVRGAIVKKNGLSYGTATYALVEAALARLGIIVRVDV